MARIYIGNQAAVSTPVLEAVQSLDDKRWVLLEFDVNGRNLDCLIICPNPNPGRTATILLTEVKETSGAYWGTWDDTWHINRNGQWVPLVMSNPRDANPTQQMRNAANAFNVWLHDNYFSYMTPGNDRLPHHRISCYPFLLILSPPQVASQHRIGRPQQAYGNIYYALDNWLQAVQAWDTNLSFPLATDDIERMVGRLAVHPYSAAPAADDDAPLVIDVPAAGGQRDPDGPLPDAASAEVAAVMPPVPSDPLHWLANLEQWMRTVERRFDGLEERLGPRPRATRSANPVNRALTEAEVTALTAAIRTIATRGGNRDFPTVINMTNSYLGYRLQDTKYNDFLKARAFFDQAVQQEIIQFGPNSGPAPTVYLRDERVPDA